MSRKHTHAYATFQRGKGLVGFLAGLVLATMIIIAVLLMLNSNSKRDFRNLPQTASEPQILTPNGQANDGPQNASNIQLPEMITDKNRGDQHTADTITQPNQTASNEAASTPPTSSGEATANTEQTEEPNQQTTGETDVTESEEPQKNTMQSADDKRTNDAIQNIPEIDTRTPPPPHRRPHNNANNMNNGSTTVNKSRPYYPPRQDEVYVPEWETPRRNPNNTRPSATQQRPNRDTTVSRPPRTTVEPTVTPPNKPKASTNNNTVSKPKDTTVRKPTPTHTPPKKDNDVKPTPQQILDSGNIEKAREMARKQAKSAASTVATRSTAAPAVNQSAAKRGAVVIQAGAYGSRNAAEQQRARLALLGVQTKIVEANVNGKSTFRVQTHRIDGTQANSARTVLQKNGISTLERNAE